MTLDQFSRRMFFRASNLPGAVNVIVKRVVLAADQVLVTSTPVDTGTARSNWQVSVGSPVEETIDAYVPITPGTDPGKLSETGNAQAAINQGQIAVANRQSGQTVFITNNLSYIEALNRGSSAQAPAMFVEAAVEAAVQAVRTSKLDTGRRQQ